MWKITICYHTIHKDTGKMNPKPKLVSNLYHSKRECKNYEQNFYNPLRVVMWVYMERFIGYLDEFFKDK